MTKYKCEIHDHKPDACAMYPQAKRHMKWLDNAECGYWFDEKGQRQGECLRCGVCCGNVSLKFSTGERITSAKCPYLIEVSDGN